MSKLMAKLKQEAQRLKEQADNRQNFEKIDWFMPKTGDNPIRILPNKNNADDIFFKEVRLHFVPTQKNDGSFVNLPCRCLGDFDEECPMCVAYEKLVKKDKDKARSLRATTRYLYNVVNYLEKKIQPYAAPLTVHQAIFEWVEELNSNIVDLDEGRDWKITKKVDPKKPKNLGISYSVKPTLKDSTLPEKLAAMIETQSTDLDELYKSNEKEKMQEFLGIKPAAAEEDEEEDDMEAAALDFGDDEKEAKASKEKVLKAKEKAKKVEEDDEEDEADDDEEEEEPVVKKKKAAPVEEEDELDKELRDLGVM